MNRCRVLYLIFAIMPVVLGYAQDAEWEDDALDGVEQWAGEENDISLPMASIAAPVVETPLLPAGTSVKTIITVNGQEQILELVGMNSGPVSNSNSGTAARRPVPPIRPVQIKVSPKMPDPRNGLVYRVQVGTYANTGNARRCFDRLRDAGFRPAYEQNGKYYRVLIPGVRAADVSGIIDRLGSAGFSEAWLREEY